VAGNREGPQIVCCWPIADEPRDVAEICDRGGSGHGPVRLDV